MAYCSVMPPVNYLTMHVRVMSGNAVTLKFGISKGPVTLGNFSCNLFRNLFCAVTRQVASYTSFNSSFNS